jgi:S-DNA-T family DNA segregation ATPase FtsK/SpoIIIE
MIDEAAAMCCVKKGSKDMGSVEAGGSSNLPDVLFRKALEISIDNGSVATSMLQRNLNVGYGRAARIIDRMELLNFVSPPRGNKHREVLISREKFNQMIMDGDPKVDGYADK